MKKRLFLVSVILILLSIITITYLNLNARGIFVLGCAIYKNTGLACPTCGFTDTLQHILALDFKSAYKSNAYMFLTLPIWFFILINFLTNYIKNGTWLKSKHINIVLFSLIIAGILFGIFRNF